jgi:hypothetical protein
MLVVVIALIFNQLMNINIGMWLSPAAALVATALVFIVPVAASVIPILRVLSTSITDGLDKRRSRTKGVEISLERSEHKKKPWSLLVFGISASLFGFTIYYVFPFSLLTGQLVITMYVLVFLLIGMLFGLVLLSGNLQQVLQRALVFVCFFWDHPSIRSLLHKNLVGHRITNQKTTIMYSLSLGFIIFLSVSYSLQAQTFLFQQQKSSGAFLVIHATGVVPGEFESG